MNSFRTILEKTSYPFKIDHQHSIIMFGSCFSENIGQLLSDFKYKVSSNPLGILYNPLSICASLKRSLQNKAISSDELISNNDRYYHWDFHSNFSAGTQDELVTKINSAINGMQQKLSSCDYLFITLGTALAFKYKASDTLVGNCHKVSNDKFERIEFSIEEIETRFRELIEHLVQFNPNIKIIFTVSPVRHHRDGLITNQRSKSKLLIAAHRLSSHFANVFYFPSYELIIDDLRDYRFYTEDMIHISKSGVDYIWDYFLQSFVDEKNRSLHKKIEKINSDLLHRPFYPGSANHVKFLYNIKMKITQLMQEHPVLRYDDELTHLDSLLDKYAN